MTRKYSISYGRDVVMDVLDYLGIEIVSESNGWAKTLCPGHESDTSMPSFAIDLEHGGWICRAGCELGSNADLAYLIVKVQGEGNVRDVRHKLRQRAIDDDGILDRMLSQPDIVEESAPVSIDLEYTHRATHQYFFRRGFTKATAAKWDVGKDPVIPAIVIPVTEHGQTIALIKRCLYGDPKYLYSKGFVKQDHLFGLDHVTGTWVIVVEGALDAMYLDQHGYPGVAILGSSISETQVALLCKSFWAVTLAFDNDKAGRNATDKAVDRLKNRLSVTVAELPSTRKDIAECTSSELTSIFDGIIV